VDANQLTVQLNESPDRDRSTSGRSPLALWRRRFAGMGILALCGLAAFGTIGGNQVLAAVAFVCLAIGTVLAWVELNHTRRHPRLGGRAPTPMIDRSESSRPVKGSSNTHRRTGLLAIAIVTVTAAGAVQTWYTPGTAIAGGDLAPPNGTAWIGQLFASWTWSGSDLGRPGSLQVQLPWAAVLWTVHELGGSSTLAQRLWYTLLFAGAALSTLWLLRLLHASWIASAVGSLLFIFNPFVLSNIGTNPVFLAALVLVVLEPAIVLSVCSGRWRRRTGAVAFVATVPLVGYAYENPPLVLAIAAATLASIVVSALWFGRPFRWRALGFLALGIPLGLLASLYWILPSIEQLHFDAVTQISALSSWTWTEGRSTLANAFWLNTSWAWPFKEYVPYNGNYSALPLSLLRYAFPLLAFTSLSFRYGTPAKSIRQLSLVASGATGSLLVIFLSTGTRLPGSLLFDRFYQLPYGWLLQGPGRFLILAGVGYAVMAVVTVDTWMAGLDHFLCSARAWLARKRRTAQIGFAVVVVGAAGLAPGYPLAFGAIVPGPRPGSIPSSHVHVPRYWDELASYLNSPNSPQGNLLVLPPDPFYQMPYTWGYYGNDGFITDMVRRNVVDPSGQGYGAAGQELLTAVNQIASSLLAGHDTAANRILDSLTTPDILVRGDINTHYPGSTIDSPTKLAAALQADPAVTLVDRSGPLSVYRLLRSDRRLDGVQRTVRYATTESSDPNLLALPALSAGTVLVHHRPISGVPAIVQVPNIPSWKLQGRKLHEVVALPPGRSYAVTQLGTRGTETHSVPVGVGMSVTVGTMQVRVRSTTVGTKATVSTGVGRNQLVDGNFDSGSWGKVGNCDAVAGGPPPDLSTRLGPPPASESGRTLLLSAGAEIACEAKTVAWNGGAVLLSLSARDVSGNGPALCVWEIGPNRCASLPVLDASHQWRTYQQLVTPPPGTTGLSVFLYADGGGGVHTVDAYASVSIRSLPTSASLVFIAASHDGNANPPVLTTADSTYSSIWAVAGRAEHVQVNGMTNGWLTRTTRRLVPYETISSLFTAGYVATVASWLVTLVLAGSVVAGVLLPWRRRRAGAQTRNARVDGSSQRGHHAVR